MFAAATCPSKTKDFICFMIHISARQNNNNQKNSSEQYLIDQMKVQESCIQGG